MPEKRTKPPVGEARESRGGSSSSSHYGLREYAAVVLLAFSAFLLLSLASYDPRDPSFNTATTRPEVSNLCGLIGSHVADALVQLLGICSIVIPVGLLLLALRSLQTMWFALGRSHMIALFLAISGVSMLLDRFGRAIGLQMESPGGALGAFMHGVFSHWCGTAGEIVLALTFVVLGGLHVSGVSLGDVVHVGRKLSARAATVVADVRERLRVPAPAAHTAAAIGESAGPSVELLPVLAQPQEQATPLIVHRRDAAPPPTPVRSTTGASWERLSVLPADESDGRLAWELNEPVDVAVFPPDGEPETIFPWQHMEGPSEGDSDIRTCAEEAELEAAIEEYLKETHTSNKRRRRRSANDEEEAGNNHSLVKVARRADEEICVAAAMDQPYSNDPYVLPPADLLDEPPRSNRTVDRALLQQNAIILEQKLSDLGVEGRVVAIHPGPVITMYELSLASGIPLRKVLNMSDDLAMALKSGSTRVVAPIPGKDTVGIEVPNLNREIVYFREIVESPGFQESDAPLKMALGKEIDGEPFSTSLAKMPHLLIAGATGTGKSVGLNSLICSWLMCCHPDDLKLLLVDPKKLELSHYEDIPHLLHPVVTDPEKVPAVLGWAIREMERRYDILSKVGAKNILGYNQKIRAGEVPPNEDGTPAPKLPYIVIIVDELAELMMVAAKDIEISIARLAQMARASGIHLILATQRPSVDVITGIIKANFPARLSFQVSAKADSRTILDTVGAENLLGMGDMLFLPPGASKLRRLHGAYISEKEIGRIVDFIKAQRRPLYLQEISRHVADDGPKSTSDPLQEDKYDEAVELVTRLGHASISLIQRHMRIGYNRAARIMEAMEAEGIVGPSDGTSRPRPVLVGSLDHIPDRP
ncbi:MAG: DNA translocase FtsK 4TM domain-containing protein [Desulfomonile sp.]|nr:DNA translocase FtsK 4TM domain-containing protein [Desulfomonile sp.]